MAITIKIHESVASADDMADLLDNVADQIRAGMTRGFHPGWELDGNEEQDGEEG